MYFHDERLRNIYSTPEGQDQIRGIFSDVFQSVYSSVKEEERKRREREELRASIESRNQELDQQWQDRTTLKGHAKALFSKEGAKSAGKVGKAIVTAPVEAGKGLYGLGKTIVKGAKEPYEGMSEHGATMSKFLEERKERGIAAAGQRLFGDPVQMTPQQRINSMLQIPDRVAEAKELAPDRQISKEQEEVLKELAQDKQKYNRGWIKDYKQAQNAGDFEVMAKLNKEYQLVHQLGEFTDESGFEVSLEEYKQAQLSFMKHGAVALADLISIGLAPLTGGVSLGAGALKLGVKAAAPKILSKAGQWIMKNGRILGMEAGLGAVSGGVRADIEDQDVLQGALTGGLFATAGVTGLHFGGKTIALGGRAVWNSGKEKVAEIAAQKAANAQFRKETGEAVSARMIAQSINNNLYIDTPPEVLNSLTEEAMRGLGRGVGDKAAHLVDAIEEVMANPASRIQMPKIKELTEAIIEKPPSDFKKMMNEQYYKFLSDDELKQLQTTGFLPSTEGGTAFIRPGKVPNPAQLAQEGKKHLVIVNKDIDIDNSGLIPISKVNVSGANVDDFKLNYVDELVQQARDEASVIPTAVRTVDDTAEDFAYKSLREVSTELDSVAKQLKEATDPVEVNRLARRLEELEGVVGNKLQRQAEATQSYQGKVQEYESALNQREMVSSAIGEKAIARIKSAYSRGVIPEKVKGLDDLSQEYSMSQNPGTNAKHYMDVDDFYEMVGKLPTKKEINAMKPTRADLDMTKDTYALKRPVEEIPETVTAQPKVSKGMEKQSIAETKPAPASSPDLADLPPDLVKEARKYKSAEEFVKTKQLEHILRDNPMTDSYHTGIRTLEDVKTFEEAYKDPESFVYPDFTKKQATEALNSGRITIYSSKPLNSDSGQFVSPSKMQANDYAGGGKIYSKTVDLNNVAWINGDEGQLTGATASKADDLYNRVHASPETVTAQPKIPKPAPETPAKPATPTKPVPLEPIGEGKLRKSRLAERTAELLKMTREEFGDLPEYRKASYPKQLEKASEIIDKNLDDAVKMVRGDIEMPDDMLPQALHIALKQKAKTDKDLARELVNSSMVSLRSTRAGQEIGILGWEARMLDQGDPTTIMQKLKKERTKAMQEMAERKGTTYENIVKDEIKKAQTQIKKADMKIDALNKFIDDIRC